MNATDEWLSRTSKNCERLLHERQQLEEREYRSYLQTAFHGGNEDWVQWINQDELIANIQKCIWRMFPDDALIEIQKLLADAITQAAKGHVDQCSRNGTL